MIRYWPIKSLLLGRICCFGVWYSDLHCSQKCQTYLSGLSILDGHVNLCETSFFRLQVGQEAIGKTAKITIRNLWPSTTYKTTNVFREILEYKIQILNIKNMPVAKSVTVELGESQHRLRDTVALGKESLYKKSCQAHFQQVTRKTVL
jgi:hypothetical protein